MPTIVISYFSKSGNTRQMAELIAEGAGQVEGCMVTLKGVAETEMADLEAADCIILGSPTYFGTLAAEVKDLLDRSVKVFGRLNGKVGGAFTSSGGMAGGNETTLISMIQGLLVHGMVVQGVQRGGHYGPVAIAAPGDQAAKECRRYGKLLAELTVKLKK